MSNIIYKQGDATQINPNKNTFILHVCNNIGKWGAGFTKAIDKQWQKPKTDYLDFVYNKKREGFTPNDLLGNCVFTYIPNPHAKTWVCIVNMIAQNGVKSKNNTQPINYYALELCLKDFKRQFNNSIKHDIEVVQMPRIGCGLAGGEWNKIEPLINKWSINPTYVYDF